MIVIRAKVALVEVIAEIQFRKQLLSDCYRGTVNKPKFGALQVVVHYIRVAGVSKGDKMF